MTSLPARRAFAAGIGVAALTATLIAGASPAGAAPKKPHPHTPPVDLQLLAVNDFHGQLEPSTSSSGSVLPGFGSERFGGVEFLATQIEQLEAAAPGESLTVAAGDLIGASPLLSAAFHDEPTIEAFNAIGMDFASVGNHEFDEGPAELLRIQDGGCHPTDGCSDPANPYEGADFQYLSANAFRTATGQPLLPPYGTTEVGGITVGFIGLTLEGTPSVVTPSGVAGLQFADEAETANRYAKELRKQGVQTIIVLMHEGGTQTGATSVDGCNALTGAITQIVPQMHPSIDAVISGHTHQAYNCREVDGAFVPADSTTQGTLVTSAANIGKLVTDIDLTLDPHNGDVLTATSDNVPVHKTPNTQDAEMTALIARWRALLGPIAGEVVGATAEGTALSSARDILFGTVEGESPIGNLIADAQLEATQDQTGAVAAFMNPGGVRSSISEGPITYEEAFSVQPFGNYLSTITLTGAQIQCVLEQQFVVGDAARRNVLQPSGITYEVNTNGTTGTSADQCSGTRVPDDSVTIAGAPMVDTAEYRITVNNFLADGGDGFSTLLAGTNRVDIADPEDDLAALIDYLMAHNPTTPPATDRITVVTE
jgi:5'-nucleotidase